MKKKDEMRREIRLRSSEAGYKFFLLALVSWDLFELWKAISDSVQLNMWPTFLLAGGLCVQGFYERWLQQKITEGDEKTHEPNKLLFGIILVVAAAVMIICVGYLLKSF